MGTEAGSFAPALIAFLAAVFTTVVGKWMDGRSEEKRRRDEGRRVEDHDIRVENAQLRAEVVDLREDLAREREMRLMTALRCRELVAVMRRHNIIEQALDAGEEDDT